MPGFCCYAFHKSAKSQSTRESEVIGEGFFGRAYKRIEVQRNGTSRTLFEKHFREEVDDIEEWASSNWQNLKRFDNHHIVQFIAASIQDNCVRFTMEFIEHGDLRTFLRVHKPFEMKPLSDYVYFSSLIIPPLEQMAIEVADGMAYLESMGFVHGELSAEKCFVTADLTIKIGGYETPRCAEYNSHYYNEPIKVSPRWLAPESIAALHYTNQSDVYSFGVLLWEIATYGDTPYHVNQFNYFFIASLIIQSFPVGTRW